MYVFTLVTSVNQYEAQVPIDGIEGSSEVEFVQHTDSLSRAIFYSYVGIPTDDVVKVKVPAFNYLTHYQFTAYQA